MEKKFKKEIENCIVLTRTYNTNTQMNINHIENMKVEIIALDSVSAIFEEHADNQKMAVLNFASYKNPGGMFIKGSKAQEECLCHESFLL